MAPFSNGSGIGEQRTQSQGGNFGDEEEAVTSPSGKKSPFSQRREHSRYDVELDVTLGSEHNFYAGFVENLSVGGIFVATHTLRKVGEVVDFSLDLPDHGKAVRGTGEVRWIREFSEHSDGSPGMGVRFLELEPGSLEAIESFLRHREPMFYEE